MKIIKEFTLLILVVFALSAGAFSRAAEPDNQPAVVTNLEDLTEAINTASDGDTIYLSGNIDISGSIEIGNLDKSIFLCGMPESPVVISVLDSIPDGECALFRNLTLLGDSSTGIVLEQHGGASYFENVCFRNSSAFTEQSVFSIKSGMATFRNCTFEESRGINGSHIYAEASSSVVINDCQFFTGLASQNGGSIYSLGDLTIRNSLFANSYAEECGGSIYASGPLQIVSSEFSGGYARNGGHIYCSTSDSAQISGCTMSGSQVEQCGGSLYADGNLILSDCRISNNIAGQSGGGIWSKQGLEVSFSKVFHNTAGVSGADICAGPGLLISDSSQDYLSLYEQELLDGGWNSAAWHLDQEGLRYSADATTAEFVTPNTVTKDFIQIVFALSYKAPPEQEPETPNPQPPAGDHEDDDELPDEDPPDEELPDEDPPGEGITPPPESEGSPPPSVDVDDDSMNNSWSSAPQRPGSVGHADPPDSIPDESSPIILRCGLVEIDIEHLEEFCNTLPKYIPADKIITREEVAGFVYGLAGKPALGLQRESFSDIKSSPFREAIGFLSSSGVVSGCGGSKFNPSSPLTKAQLLTILARFTEPVDIALTNIDVSGHWAETSVKTAVASGWIEDSPIDLQAPVTFGGFIEILGAIIQVSK